MSQSVDEDEHSIEMHLPYVYKMLARYVLPHRRSLILLWGPCQSPSHYSTNAADVLTEHSANSDYNPPTPLIPILIGNTTPTLEQEYGRLLAPHLADPTSIFIISSDFAHWGTRFRYTYYRPLSGPAVNLRAADNPSSPQIHESIAAVDMECVACVESGSHEAFLEVLGRTGNTVCGRHPIGVAMAAVECLEKEGRVVEGDGKGRFRFVRYERSGDVVSGRESSVSYCSAFAVL